MIKIYNSFGNDFLYPDINNILVFFENHDTERFNEIFKGDVRYYKMAMSLIATIRGIPQIYYGSEIGMQGDKNKGGDADIRRDFPGGWKDDSQNAFDPKTQTSAQKEFHHYTQKLLNWRKGKGVIHTGKTKHYMPKEKVYVYFRYNDSVVETGRDLSTSRATNEKVMVVINNNEKDQTFDLSRFAESLSGVSRGKDVISGKEFSVSSQNKLTVSGKSSLILELQ
jgi:glycosidase